MRLFTCINLNSEVLDYFYNLQKELSNNLPAKINWVSKSKIHITVKFFGEVSEDGAVKIQNSLKKVKFNKFKLQLTQIGFFPNEEYVKVIWVGVDEVDKVKDLQKKVDEVTLGFNEIKLGGHITLGRVKFVKNKDKFFKILKELNINKISFNVDKFCLVKSILTKDGPKYEVLESYTS